MNDLFLEADISFADDFSTAMRSDGLELRFTKSESLILSHLASRKGYAVSRNSLLDVISGIGSDKNDRNVDFVINRLRKKLEDDPKEPAFIATRYGEGYVWVHNQAETKAPAQSPSLVIGPIKGAKIPKAATLAASAFAANVVNNINALRRPDQAVTLEKDFAKARFSTQSPPEFHLELTFFVENEKLSCIATTKVFMSGHIVGAKRIELGDEAHAFKNAPEIDPTLFSNLLSEMWKVKALQTLDAPLSVAMHDAAGLTAGSNESWDEIDKHLKRLRLDSPDDASLKIMYATHLHSKYVQLGIELFLNSTDNCKEDEDEIERLVLEALPDIEARPDLMIVAAKLLQFLRRGYSEMAMQMAEDAHRNNTNIAASLTTVGQMRVFSGRIEEGLSCLQQAAKLCKRGSEEHIYVLVLICQAHMATNDRKQLAVARRDLYSARKMVMLFFEVLLTDPKKPSLRARGTVMMLSKARAKAMLKMFYYVGGRLFISDEHRENFMRTPLTLLRQRFGDDVVPSEMV